jgi:hypothetical protein
MKETGGYLDLSPAKHEADPGISALYPAYLGQVSLEYLMELGCIDDVR